MAKILLVSSAGGHFSELMQLRDLTNNHEVVICTEDKIKNENVSHYLIYGSRNEGFVYIKKFLKNFARAFKIAKEVKPDIIISTGAHTCVPFYYWAKLHGVKTIYIESYAKVNSPSLTYKLIKPFVDVTVVQHEQMLNVYKNAKYLGSVY